MLASYTVPDVFWVGNKSMGQTECTLVLHTDAIANECLCGRSSGMLLSLHLRLTR